MTTKKSLILTSDEMKNIFQLWESGIRENMIIAQDTLLVAVLNGRTKYAYRDNDKPVKVYTTNTGHVKDNADFHFRSSRYQGGYRDEYHYTINNYNTRIIIPMSATIDLNINSCGGRKKIEKVICLTTKRLIKKGTGKTPPKYEENDFIFKNPSTAYRICYNRDIYDKEVAGYALTSKILFGDFVLKPNE